MIPGSIFVGMGFNQVRVWFGYEPLNDLYTMGAGLLLILVFYVLPSAASYFFAEKKVQQYYPITNEVIQKHRDFFIQHISEEIYYLQQAVDTCIEFGMNDDYNLFLKELKTMEEIRSKILVNERLHREHLKTLNQVFNRGYLIKKLQ